MTPDQQIDFIVSQSARYERNGREIRVPCKAHGGDERDVNLALNIGDGRLLARCHSHDCSFISIIDSFGLRGVKVEAGPYKPRPPEPVNKWKLKVYRSLVPIPEEAAAHRWAERFCVDIAGADLRWLPYAALKRHWPDSVGVGAIVASLATPGETGVARGISLVLINEDGTPGKFSPSKPDKLTIRLVSSSLSGMWGVLCRPESMSAVVVEGVKSALAAQEIAKTSTIAYVPGASNMNENLANNIVSAGYNRVMVCEDPDEVGRQKARALVGFLGEHGVVAKLWSPPEGQGDLADVIALNSAHNPLTSIRS